MKKLLFVLLVSCQILAAQNTRETTYQGVVERYNSELNIFINEIATCTVVKTVKKDSVSFSYVLLHDNDTTMYEIKYPSDRCCTVVRHWGIDWVVSDSLEIKDEYIYIYDIIDPDRDQVEGFFCLSPSFGLVSIGNFSGGEYFKLDASPRFYDLIEPYRKEWVSNH